MKVPRFVSYWMPVVVWMLIIFVGSTDVLSAEQTSRFLVPFLRWLDPQMSVATIATIHFALRKLGHLTEYAVLAMLFWRGLRRGANLQMKISILFLLAWLAAGIFAVTDEFHQSFVPSRTASAHDVMIDICGAFIGLTVCWAFACRAQEKAREITAP